MKRVLINISGNYYYEIEDADIKNASAVKKSMYDISAICQYFMNAYYVKILLDKTKCILCEESILSNESWLTDGSWIWSGDMIHYIKEHYCNLPDEFIQSLKLKDYRMEEMSDLLIVELSDKYGLPDEEVEKKIKRELLKN